MAETTGTYDDGERRSVILAALSSINLTDYDTPEMESLVIAKTISHYFRYLNPISVQQRMLGAVRIYAEIIDFKFEESSQRYLVRFKALKNNSEDRIEHIRTDRIDGRDGGFVRLMMREGNASKIIGRHAIIYKVNEEIKNQNGRTFRVTPFIDFLD